MHLNKHSSDTHLAALSSQALNAAQKRSELTGALERKMELLSRNVTGEEESTDTSIKRLRAYEVLLLQEHACICPSMGTHTRRWARQAKNAELFGRQLSEIEPETSMNTA